MAASAPSTSAVGVPGRWPGRYTVAVLFFLATMLCYVDRISISIAIIPLARAEGYDSAAQGLILSAFFWGYIWPQLAGGWLADRAGGKRVLGAGVAVWSLATLVTPLAASVSFAALFAIRVVLGLGEGVNFPSIHSLTARWMLPEERSRVVSLNFSGMHLGTTLALLLSPLIIVAFGWPMLFYLSGLVGVVWVTVWMIKVADRPESSTTIHPAELAAITAARTAAARASSVPWEAIAREPAVWAIVLAHFCSNFGFNILLLWLPTYLHHQFKVELLKVGAWSLIPWITTFFVANTGGWIADALLARDIPVGTVRKTLQSIAFGFGALPLLALPMAQSAGSAVALLTVSAASSGLGLSGHAVNHLDIGPTHAGVLMGISNTIATLPGIVGVAATGFILRATDSFSAVFYLIAAVYAVGLIGYATLGSGERKL
jgi:MFS transporter, ACS family, solute carrier family 17 (sodium-dependent inorganic phosphate cotransporter), other